MPEAANSITVPASADEVWAALADFGAIVAWAPNVDHSRLLTAEACGVGAVRRVQVGRIALRETVVAWDPPTLLAYTITGLPARLGEVRTEWRVSDRAAGCEVALVNAVDPGPRPPQQLVGRIAARRLAASSTKMLAGLAAHVTQGAHE